MTYSSLINSIETRDFAYVMGQLTNSFLLKAIADRLKEIRNNRSLSQEDVYNDTGIHVARIEVAKANITVSTLEALCRYYDISLKFFFDSINF
jgi:DNA-binding Xre family transcriptional regulator